MKRESSPLQGTAAIGLGKALQAAKDTYETKIALQTARLELDRENCWMEKLRERLNLREDQVLILWNSMNRINYWTERIANLEQELAQEQVAGRQEAV